MNGVEGTRWRGSAELWLDPLGDIAERSDCTLAIDGETVNYTWSYQGSPQSGLIVLSPTGAQFSDTWHQPEPMTCQRLQGARGLFQVLGAYGPDGDWGWRIGLHQRTPSGEMVLQMTNITPWGEEVRAVRMVCSPA
jgi:hypothetical protein